MIRQVSLALVLFTFAVSCVITGPCENSPIIEIPSTDSSVSAWVFVRDCGATTARSTQVSILDAGEDPPRGAGNAFIIDVEAQVVATWRESDRVIISYEEIGEVMKQESAIGAVSITYRAE